MRRAWRGYALRFFDGISRKGINTKKATKHNVLLPKKSSKCYEKIIVERKTGLEPATYSLEGCRSTG